MQTEPPRRRNIASGHRSLRRRYLALSLATLAAIITAILGALWWARTPTIVHLAIGPVSDDVSRGLEAWARAVNNADGRYRLELMRIPTTDQVLQALRANRAAIGVMFIDGTIQEDLRSIAVLQRDYIVTLPGAARSEPRLQNIASQLASAGVSAGALRNIAVESERNLSRLKASRSRILTFDRLGLEGAAMPELWHLGALIEPPEPEPSVPDWRTGALSLQTHLVTLDRTDVELVNQLSGLFHNALRGLQSRIGVLRFASLTSSEDGSAILRAHDGVASFVEHERQTLYERYGEWTFLGLTALGLIATAGVVFATWIHRSMHLGGHRQIVVLTRLMERIGRSNSREELERAHRRLGVLTVGFEIGRAHV